MLPDARASDSIERCSAAIKTLFQISGLPFSSFDQNKIDQCLSEDELQKIAINYWYEYDYDKRTKRSDLKRELSKVVTHLRSLNKAMKKVTDQTKKTVNYVIYEENLAIESKSDVFGAALSANKQLEIHCTKLVKGNHTKQKPTSLYNCSAVLIGVWEKLADEKFKYNTKTHRILSARSLTKDLKEFDGPGPRFLHVALQACTSVIDASQASAPTQAAPSGSSRPTT